LRSSSLSFFRLGVDERLVLSASALAGGVFERVSLLLSILLSFLSVLPSVLPPPPRLRLPRSLESIGLGLGLEGCREELPELEEGFELAEDEPPPLVLGFETGFELGAFFDGPELFEALLEVFEPLLFELPELPLDDDGFEALEPPPEEPAAAAMEIDEVVSATTMTKLEARRILLIGAQASTRRA
jgi:hypothetical protein